MKQLRCAKCKKLLAYANLIHGELEIKCRNCKHITRAEAIHKSIVFDLLSKRVRVRKLKQKGGEKYG